MASSVNAVNISILQKQVALLNTAMASLSSSVASLTNIASQNSSSVLALSSEYNQLELQQTTDMQAISSMQSIVNNSCVLQSNPVNVNGETGGVIQYIYTNSGLYKKYVFIFQDYINNTSNNQTISLPLAFNNSPLMNTNLDLSFIPTVNSLQIQTPGSSLSYTGILTLEGV